MNKLRVAVDKSSDGGKPSDERFAGVKFTG